MRGNGPMVVCAKFPSKGRNIQWGQQNLGKGIGKKQLLMKGGFGPYSRMEMLKLTEERILVGGILLNLRAIISPHMNRFDESNGKNVNEMILILIHGMIISKKVKSLFCFNFDF